MHAVMFRKRAKKEERKEGLCFSLSAHTLHPHQHPVQRLQEIRPVRLAERRRAASYPVHPGAQVFHDRACGDRAADAGGGSLLDRFASNAPGSPIRTGPTIPAGHRARTLA